MTRQISYDGLQMFISEAQIDAEIRKGSNGFTSRKWYKIVAIASVFIGWIVGPFGATTATARLGVFLTAAVLVALALLGVGRVALGAYRKLVANQLRLIAFAQDNELVYVEEIKKPAYPGAIFQTGSQRRIYSQFLGEANGEFEIGNYEYTVQHGKSSSTYQYGYIRIALERHVVHMLLDGKANNTNIFKASFSNLPISMARDQTLELEGDFNEHFTLYAPKEYERDAYYIFTPDLMALLIDEVGQFDVEVIDDQLFVYGKEFNFFDVATWQRIMAIITTVGAKTISQTDFYADEQIGDRTLDVVAAGGRRLRRGIPWSVVVVVVFGLLMAGAQLLVHGAIQR